MLIRDIRIEFDDPGVFLEEYERNLSSGWIFVQSDADLELGEVVEVTLDLSFCGHSARALAIVKSRIGPALAKMLDRAPGVVVEFADGIAALEEMLQDTMDELVSTTWTRNDHSSAPRRHERLEVSIRGEFEHAGERVPTRTRNLSQSGALLEIEGLALVAGQQVSLSLVDPTTGELVALSARVVRPGDDSGPHSSATVQISVPASGSSPAPPGSERAAPAAATPSAPPPSTQAVAVEFVDSARADSRRAQFLSQVRAVTHGRRMGGISGNLSGLSLPSLLQSIASSSEQGTMEIIGEHGEAHILFESNRFRYAALGKIEGIKALARLLEWPEGEFTFQPSIDADEPQRPLIPIDQAIMQAMHHAEELQRLEGELLPDTVVLERTGDTTLPGELSETETSVLRMLERPGCPSTLLDALPDPDADIWRALLRLIQHGMLILRD